MAMAAAPGKAASGTRSDAFVTEQLTRAERRIRLLDLSTARLGFLAGTLAFAVLIALCDRNWQLSGPIRQLAFLLYLAGSSTYLGLTVVRPLLRKINPYYAARQMEQTLPQAKNSVINWLDLHGQKLPPAVRGAIGVRAARDLAKADMEKAISGQRALITGVIAAALGGIFLFLFLMFGPRQFGSLLQRTFAPFDLRTTVSKRTNLTVVRPEGGNARIPAGLAVTLATHVGGRVPEPGKPDAVKLHWRYDRNQEYQVLPLTPQESARDWATVLSITDVREGFYYKITGGDDETDEYQVTIVAAPMPTEVIATYHYRPYVGKLDEVRRDRKIEALRGTEVSLLVRTNRTIKAGQLLLESRTGKQTVAGQVAGDDPHAFQVRFVIDESGMYRLHFESSEDESYTDSLYYTITALPDRPPEVEITSPSKDTQEPANGLLKVEGSARDDIGVKSLTLQYVAKGGPLLRGKEYRADKGLKLAAGGYPLSVDYKDALELNSIQTVDGKPYPMQPGMELEYWLEVSDSCDYLKANVTQSKKYKVLIVAPEKDEKKQQQAREQARKEQKEHEAREEQKRKQEEKARQEQAEKEAKDRKEQERMAEKPQNGMGDNNPEPGKGNQDEKKPEPGMGNEQNPDEKKRDEELRKQAEELKKAAEEQNKGQQGNQNQQGNQDQGQEKGQSKDANPAAGAGKEGGDAKEGQQDGKNDQGENKQGGQQDQQKQAGQQKEGGKEGQQGKQGAGKEGQQGGKEGQGENKQGQGGAGEQGQQASQGKDKGKDQGQNGPQQAGKTGSGKGDDKGAGQQAGQEKPAPAQGDQKAAAQGKEGGQDKGQGAQQARADSKEPTAGQGSSQGKEAGKDGQKGTDGSAMAKGGEKGPEGQKNQGAGKAGGEKGADPQLTRSQGKGDPDRHPPTEANLRDLERLLRDLQNADARKREQAAEELDKIKDQAKDPQTRDLARQLSEELKKNIANQAAEAKPSGQGEDPKKPPQGERPGQGKDDAGEPKEGTAKAKGGEGENGMMPQGTPKDGGKEEKKPGNPQGTNPGNPNDGKGEMGEGKATVKTPGAPSKGGSPPPGVGEKIARGKGTEEPAHPPEDPLRNNPPDPLSKRATETQLEDFKKNLDKKMLERLNMTEEAREQFLKNYADLVKRDKAGLAEKPETPPAPQQGGTISSSAAEPTTSTNTAPGTDTFAPRQGQPPPGYRDDYAEFTRMLAKPPKK